MEDAFPAVLRRLRAVRGLSHEALGLEAGLHRTYISQLERGLKSPSLATLRKLCEVLAISLSDLMSMVEQESQAIDSTGTSHF